MQICKYIFLPFRRYIGILLEYQETRSSRSNSYQINAWKKCPCSKWKHIFCETLIKYFAWKNYLEQSTGCNCLGSNYLEGNYPGVIIRGSIIQAPIVRGQFLWGPLSGGNYPGEQFSGGQLSWGAVVRGEIIRGAIVLEPTKQWRFNKKEIKIIGRELNC